MKSDFFILEKVTFSWRRVVVVVVVEMETLCCRFQKLISRKSCPLGVVVSENPICNK